MASSANDIYLQMQKIASDTQVKLQQMTDASTAKSFEYNATEAKASRDWQTLMSNTSHQREVADLKKAGLNPVLSANQGANAYTTSSASAQADNPANAYASVASSRLSGMAGIESSNIGARATRAAAASNAAAMKAASAQSAAAARYAADAQLRAAQMNYDIKKYEIDMDYEIRKYGIDNQLATTIPAAIDKIFRNSGIEGDVLKQVGNIWKFTTSNLDKVINRTVDNFRDHNYKIELPLLKPTNRTLTQLGIAKTPYNQQLFVKAVFMNDRVARSILNAIVRRKEMNANYVMTRHKGLSSDVW